MLTDAAKAKYARDYERRSRQRQRRMTDEASDDCARLRAALRELIEACEYVKPFAGAVATAASVKDIRRAARFVAAVENAKRFLED